MFQKTLVVLYTALALGANPALAGDGAAALREGDMKKLAFAETPAPLASASLVDATDAPVDLAQYRGKWMVLNFWAAWCAPCRKEMPALDRLQAAMPELAVIPVATGRNAVPALEKFFAEAGVTGLPIIRDPKSELARASGILALPVTLIINPEGEEVARLIGDAEWDGPSAKAVLAALIAGQ
jgi:thiol-disulfide isomerase/thioredoxin